MDEASDEVVEVAFGVLSEQEILRSAVTEVVNPVLYTHSIPTDDGLNSLKLGTSDSRIRCSTCRKSVRECPGHSGALRLAVPLYHVAYLETTLKVLRSVCFWCSALLAPASAQHSRRAGSSKKALAAMALAGKAVRECPVCRGPQPSYVRQGAVIDRAWPADQTFASEAEGEAAHRRFDARVAQTILRHISDDDIQKLGMDVNVSRPSDMIVSTLVVPPVAIRPSVTVDDGSRTRGQDDLTIKLNDILKTNIQLKEALKESKTSDVARLTETLQLHLSIYMDKDNSTAVQQAQRRPTTRGGACKSVASKLGGKKGRVRGNLMGKRCDFSSRSVITGDARMDIDRVGVPMYVALTQTVPERATSWNLDALRARVLVGAKKLEGAHMVLKRDGRRTALALCVNRDAVAANLEVGDVVERYLQNGDPVVFNRQPSLHKSSMQGHLAQIMKVGRSFRLPVPDTSPYNADFDGDEMNLHVPQTLEARAEVRHIMNVSSQIVSPQANAPIIGCIQVGENAQAANPRNPRAPRSRLIRRRTFCSARGD